MKRELLNKRKWQDEQASIDEEMGDALACIDQARRSRGTSSFLDFVKTYMVGLLIQDAPSPMMETVI